MLQLNKSTVRILVTAMALNKYERPTRDPLVKTFRKNPSQRLLAEIKNWS